MQVQVVISHAERAIARERARDSASALEAEGDSPPGYCGARDSAGLGLKTWGPKGSHEHCFFTNWARFRFYPAKISPFEPQFHAEFENEGPRA